MRRSKLTLVGVFLGVALLAWGQNTDPAASSGAGARPASRAAAARRLGRALQRLDLTAEQKTQVGDLLQTQRQKVKAIRQDASLTPEQRQDNI